ncbi:VgrG-related protein [Actinosynnema sp. NPDC047251]|uniref:Rhs element Vgr protein n=1 Tax=Saccharothrix espanaensis (strain ATCC 51144 / DSM 44229 / JCM 9112 / NBRC 15066 / NRRL 15764) TaxID=1179773 RepID=K0K299_SACES|nr:VgrG-related protein [Saccharothrix espanaensis]CCH32461.1 Rhs element Vgr protein [Saccharothrix espanaensis DSM 44229]
MSAVRSFAAGLTIVANAPVTREVESCVVDESVGLPDTAVLTYRDDKRTLLAKTGITIGTPLKVSVSATGGPARELLFSGEVTAVEMEVDGTGSFTVIRAMSRAHRLFRGRRVEAFQNMTASAVVAKVAKNAGLAVGRVETSRITYKHLSQPGVSDWDFLQGLAREHGAVVRVDERGRLEFTKLKPAARAPKPTADGKSPFLLRFGGNLLVLRAALSSAELANGVQVRGWDVARKKPLVAVRNNTPSKTAVPGLSSMKVNKAFRTKARNLVTDVPYATQAEATMAARSLEASISSGYAELEAVAEGNPKLRAGVPIALGGAGEAFSGRYTATAVTHVVEPAQGYRTTVVVSASHDRSLAGLVAGGTAPTRMPGLATAIVTDIKEVGGQRGWVRLKFPWLDDKYVTDWVRTVQFGGVGGGGVLSPDVNDEVLVGFEQGSLDRPYVLGGLYNGVDKPSQHDGALVDRRSGKVNRRSLSSRKGNRLELMDGPRASGVRLASGDRRLEVKVDESRGRLELAVRGPGGRGVLSSLVVDSTGITIDARNGVVQVKGRIVRLN